MKNSDRVINLNLLSRLAVLLAAILLFVALTSCHTSSDSLVSPSDASQGSLQEAIDNNVSIISDPKTVQTTNSSSSINKSEVVEASSTQGTEDGMHNTSVHASEEDSKTQKTLPDISQNVTESKNTRLNTTKTTARTKTRSKTQRTTPRTTTKTTNTTSTRSSTTTISESNEVTVSLSINCLNAVNANIEAALRYAPSGIMLDREVYRMVKDSTVYDLLKVNELKYSNLLVSANNSFLGNYVSSIGGISEGAAGRGKGGWIYSVDGVFPQTAVSNYKLIGGEHVAFYYTINSGDVEGSPY